MIKSSLINKEFYKSKRVFVTGHTGFKGAWLSMILNELGVITRGYALTPEKDCLFEKINGEKYIDSIIGDVRDVDKLKDALTNFKPEIVFHLAARAIVQDCFNNPPDAYSTNIMGTVNLFESIRECVSVKSVVIITTDKVYENKGDNAQAQIGTLVQQDKEHIESLKEEIKFLRKMMENKHI